MKWLLGVVGTLIYVGCQPPSSVDKGKGGSVGAVSGSTYMQKKNLPAKKGQVTVLCRCGKGYISWLGETPAKAKEGAYQHCESVSQSIGSCEVR